VENCSVGVEYTCWFYLGDTKVLAAVYGPKAGTKKNENPEKACIEVIWKPKTGQIG
jgi:exosome complex component RRP46